MPILSSKIFDAREIQARELGLRKEVITPVNVVVRRKDR
jgi:hypothetical protein